MNLSKERIDKFLDRKDIAQFVVTSILFFCFMIVFFALYENFSENGLTNTAKEAFKIRIHWYLLMCPAWAAIFSFCQKKFSLGYISITSILFVIALIVLLGRQEGLNEIIITFLFIFSLFGLCAVIVLSIIWLVPKLLKELAR